MRVEGSGLCVLRSGLSALHSRLRVEVRFRARVVGPTNGNRYRISSQMRVKGTRDKSSGFRVQGSGLTVEGARQCGKRREAGGQPAL